MVHICEGLTYVSKAHSSDVDLFVSITYLKRSDMLTIYINQNISHMLLKHICLENGLHR